MNLIRLLSRPLLASVFLRDGIDALRNPDDHVARFKQVEPLLEKIGLPPVLSSDARLLTRIFGALSTICGLGLAFGKAPRISALILAALNLPITLVNYPLWTATSRVERSTYARGLNLGLALTGALGMVIVDTKGKPSWTWRIKHAWETKDRKVAI